MALASRLLLWGYDHRSNRGTVTHPARQPSGPYNYRTMFIYIYTETVRE